MKKIIVWYSNRHRPSPEQVEALKDLFPTEVVKVVAPDPRPWKSAQEIARDLKSRCGPNIDGYEIVTALPMSLIKALIHRGFRPLYAVMKEVEAGPYTSYRKDDGTTHHYIFEGYKRITGVEITMVPVGE